MVQDGSTPAPTRGAPIAYTGTAVILGYSETGGGIDRHDVWIPSHGGYSPSWDAASQVVTVYQPAPDGTMYGLVNQAGGGKAVCLAELDPARNLAPTRQACGIPLTIDPTALVSPDGRYLAAQALSDQAWPRVVLVDLERVFSGSSVAATWDATSPSAWLDPTSVVVIRDDGTLLLARVGQTDLALVTGTGVPVLRLGAS